MNLTDFCLMRRTQQHNFQISVEVWATELITQLCQRQLLEHTSQSPDQRKLVILTNHWGLGQA